MPLPLPNLDDRRWADLVSEGRSLIPLYAPGWTDWNVHDPGVTLVELFAWLAEMDLYWANRIPAERARKLLALVGVTPRPPRPAHVAAAFTLAAGPLPAGLPLDLPAGLEVAGDDPGGVETVFRLSEPVALTRASLAAIQVSAQTSGTSSSTTIDWTARFRRGEPVPLFGDDPAPGAAFYLGLAMPSGEALPAGRPISLYLTFAGDPPGSSSLAARERLEDEARRAAEASCPAPGGCCRCTEPASADPTPADAAPASAPSAAGPALPPHASARTVWEIGTALGGGVAWRPLDPASGEVVDDTRSLTLDGKVVVTPPAALASQRLGGVEDALLYLRCRFASGAYDAAPALAALAVNGVLAEQSRTLPETSYATSDGPVQATLLGTGSGEPSQRLAVAQPSILASTLAVWTLEGARLRPWETRPDFDDSGRADSHLVVDLDQGFLTAGDGEAGRTFPAGATVLARYRATRGAAGNLPAGRLSRIADTPHNRALLGVGPDKTDDDAWKALRKALAAGIAVGNPLAAAGGAAGETLAAASARAAELAAGSERAVTLADYEAHARATPGVSLARVAARANLDPVFPCLSALGVVTVLVLPFLPAGRPLPSAGLLGAVAAHLGNRRLVGTRVVVAAPSYREVAVRAAVRALPRTDRAALAARVAAALDAFFHPLTGGPAGDGWPFGRDVYRAEVLRVIATVPGVDVVLSLALALPDGSERCGNLCLAPLELVAAGEHAIQVE